jgi:hypothetical protein
MWLYRAYSGNVYHSGEQTTMLPSFTQGNLISIIEFLLVSNDRTCWRGFVNSRPVLSNRTT